MSDVIEKKVRGVLSEVFRDLPVFGGPLGWEIEARLLDEATPRIVALLGDGPIRSAPSDALLLRAAEYANEALKEEPDERNLRGARRAVAYRGSPDGMKAWHALVRGYLSAAEMFDEQDQPVADPAERARLVARELRKRVIHARLSESGCDVLSTASGQFYCLLDDARPEWTSKGPRAIADEIQREEVRRAKAWAGDEE